MPRHASFLTGILILAGLPGDLFSQEPVPSPPRVKIYDTIYDKEPGRGHFQLYPREVEAVNVPDAPTIHQFAESVVPVPGWHEIIVQNPFRQESLLIRLKIHRPLNRVVASRRTLQFWYFDGGRVEVRFTPTGKVVIEKYYGFNAIDN